MSSLAQDKSVTGSGKEVSRPTEVEIAALAHELWENRGRPVGSPEEDWFQAENELIGHRDVSTAAA